MIPLGSNDVNYDIPTVNDTFQHHHNHHERFLGTPPQINMEPGNDGFQ